jgi:hypothetical protein
MVYVVCAAGDVCEPCCRRRAGSRRRWSLTILIMVSTMFSDGVVRAPATTSTDRRVTRKARVCDTNNTTASGRAVRSPRAPRLATRSLLRIDPARFDGGGRVESIGLDSVRDRVDMITLNSVRDRVEMNRLDSVRDRVAESATKWQWLPRCATWEVPRLTA